MQIVFKKIPVLARWFYVVGFIVLGSMMFAYFYYPNELNPITLQQGFIAGAIVVALGSVINSIYQFKTKNKQRKE